MHLWLDLANSPHVPFFAALIPEFTRRGHRVSVTARDFAQTIELAAQAGLQNTVIGGHGGATLRGKAQNILGRAWALTRWAREQKFDLAVSHNSYAQTAAARWLGLKSVTLMDYEHQPANHLAFRLASKVIVPRSFPAADLCRCGAAPAKVRRYDGIKEDVYLADFTPEARFAEVLKALGITNEDILVVVRPPAREALYHRFENELFAELLTRLRVSDGVRVILLPRSQTQREEYAAAGFILPTQALDGANLIAHADLVVSAGGTMNREAAALGTPAATIYAGKWAALDEELVREGRLLRLATREDINALSLTKKSVSQPRRNRELCEQVATLILE
jgi:predicted glycosyltransferase